MNSITFLGTGGGGNVLFAQIRATGGLYFELDNLRFIIDPGPGSLVNIKKLKLPNPHGILLSHLHPDHCTDVNPIIGGLDKSFLIAEEHCLKPISYTNRISKEVMECYPCVDKYHQNKVTFLKAVKPNEKVEIPTDKINRQIKSKITIETTETEHYVPTVGFKIIGSKVIGYPCDGPYFSGQEKNYENCDLIIFNVLVPYGKKSEPHKHMSVDGMIEFLKKLKHKPNVSIIQHFSFWMLKANVHSQAKIIEEHTGIRTIPAKDFMTFNLDSLKEEKKGIERFI